VIPGQPALHRPQPRIAGYDFCAIDLSTLLYPEQNLTVKQLPDGSIFLGLADSVNLFGLNSRLEVLNQEKQIINLAQIWQLLREASMETGPSDRSPKILLSLLYPQERILNYICTDFPAPLWLRQDGRLEELLSQSAQNGTLVALSLALRLEAGEILIFHTPGLTALKNSTQEDFGLMYLKSLILQNKHRPCEEIGLTISQAGWQHHGQTSMPSSVLAILKVLD
jgi:serine phosphatase RsbU (regulator of sigma subunit)